MNESDLIAQQDSQRTARAFVSFLSTAFGTDQALAGQDGFAVNQPFQYQSIGPTGVSVEGLPRSTAQNAGTAGISPALLLLGALALLVVFHKA